MEKIKIAYVFRTYLKSVSFNHFIFRSVQQTSLLRFFNFVFLINVFKFSLFTTKQIFQLRKIFIEILRGNHFNKIEYFHVFIYLNFLTFLKFAVLLLRANGGQYINYIQRNDIVFWTAFMHQSVHHSKEH